MDCNEETEEISDHDNEYCDQKECSAVPSTSSKLKLLNETADNMKDLKPYEFNSADEVRQKMKSLLDGENPNFEECDEDFVPVNIGDEEMQRNKLHLYIRSKVTGTDESKPDDIDMLKTIKPTTVRLTEINETGTFKKRGGRPPKAGSSKNIKKPRISSFYMGKLSNVVFLNRKESTD